MKKTATKLAELLLEKERIEAEIAKVSAAFSQKMEDFTSYEVTVDGKSGVIARIDSETQVFDFAWL